VFPEKRSTKYPRKKARIAPGTGGNENPRKRVKISMKSGLILWMGKNPGRVV